MERYAYRRRSDGIYVLNLEKTWEKLQLAARVIAAIENPADVVVLSARPYGAAPRARLRPRAGLGPPLVHPLPPAGPAAATPTPGIAAGPATVPGVRRPAAHATMPPPP
jgi:hypothetical protein